jgi:hypothetical protein
MGDRDHHTIRLKGAAGVIRWGYQTAATLGAWTIENGITGCDLTAPVEFVDDFRLSQAPLTFEAHVGSGIWKWPIESLIIGAGVVNARLKFLED